MLTFVGVGPGDPELVTLKAARILREAPAIAIPDTGLGESAVLKIVGDLIEGKPLIRVYMPMRGKREEWAESHAKAVEELKKVIDTYGTVAYPVLGDPSIYATSSYLMRLLTENGYECCVIPGIPAMCAAAASLKVPLCEQRETLTVLDAFEDDDELPATNAVVMKSGKRLESLKQKCEGREAFAIRNCGMDHEWLGSLSDIPNDGYSYFTTVIVK